MLVGHSGNPGGAVSSRRNKFEIIADILRLGKASRTRIVCSSNLKFGQLDKYLRWLCDQGCLTVTHANKKTIYCTTEQGRKLMERIDEVGEILRGEAT